MTTQTTMRCQTTQPLIGMKPAKTTPNTPKLDKKKWVLTRRGRFIFRGLPLLTLLALIVLGALTFISPFEAQANDSLGTSGAVAVHVKSGQTLWELAQEVDPQADTRDVVDQIMKINDLKTGKVEAGQTILLPVISTK